MSLLMKMICIVCIVAIATTEAKPIKSSLSTHTNKSELEVLRRFRRSSESMFTSHHARILDRQLKRKILKTFFRDEQAGSPFNVCVERYLERHGHRNMAHAVRHCVMRLR
uniref:Uncharacterized LOC100186848 n=1 Tax=Ciona intestinalis TaxID=7719 RepID=H2XNR9_CIOIN|nr:uncharacterized protein LOC100186848 [Ciona intestinalis]|eukprot:XP_002119221.1 uncharacterized protein LOC100186848 [Ciona intestinalis]